MEQGSFRVRAVLTAVLLFAAVAASAENAAAPAVAAAPTVAAAPISQTDASSLLERLLPGAAGLTCAETTVGGRAGYAFRGVIGGEPCEAMVDAVVPRVVEVHRNGRETHAWPGIYAVAHRGAARFAPENTLAAYRKAIELGAHAIEMDVRQTKDGRLVLMHDPIVSRTTGGQGLVEALTLDEIKALDAGARFDPAFAGERVPTLEEALDTLAGKAMPDIDFKAGDVTKVVELLRDKGFFGKATLATSNPDICRRVLELSGGQVFVRPPLPNDADPVGRLLRELGPPLVNIDNVAQFRPIHCAGMKVFTNTMAFSEQKERERIEVAIEAHADYIQTDRLDVLVPLLKEKGLYAAPR